MNRRETSTPWRSPFERGTLDIPHPRLLIVEDESIVAMDLEEQLIDMGYEVCGTADNGASAIALAESQRPNLVLMDIVIKGPRDGIDTAAEISRRLHIPVIFLTAYGDPATIDRAVASAPYGYLTKPYQAKELRAAIQVALYKFELENRLRDSEQWFAATLHCVADGVIATDEHACIQFVNPAAERLLGWSADEALDRNIHEVLKLEDPRSAQPVSLPVVDHFGERNTAGMLFGSWLISRDGARRAVDYSSAPIRDGLGRVVGGVIALRDVSQRLEAEEELRQSEERFRTAFDFAPVGMALVALDGEFLQGNASIRELLQCSEEQLLQLYQMEVSNPDDAFKENELLMQLLAGQARAVQFEKRYVRQKDKRDVWTLVSVSLLRRRDVPVCYLYQIHDLSGRKEAELQLARLAHYDTLTGLANRARLRDEIDRSILTARRNRTQFAVVFMDLDHFKQVNDTLGHEAGDHLLQVVANRLVRAVRETDCLARLGGDEFVLLAPEVDSAEDVTVITDKIRTQLLQPIPIESQMIRIGVSMGVSLFPDDGQDANTLLRCADSALYQAKAEGRNNVQFYRPELTARLEERVRLEAQLRQAIERNEFELHYQPVLPLRADGPLSAEALIRWRHPVLGIVPPDAFIPLAEETGLILPIGEWAIHRACEEAVNWAEDGRPPVGIAVNLSSRQFKDGRLPSIVEAALARSSLAPHLLCLEITEQSLLSDTEHNLNVIDSLKQLGVRIAIDDFGVGYSSLTYVKRFSPHRLKIDRTFVHGLDKDNQEDIAIVKAVIALAHSLRLEVVGEGIETEGQRVFLQHENCDAGQGFLFLHPMPGADFEAWLNGYQTPRGAA